MLDVRPKAEDSVLVSDTVDVEIEVLLALVTGWLSGL
jgi:hypothetical protein